MEGESSAAATRGRRRWAMCGGLDRRCGPERPRLGYRRPYSSNRAIRFPFWRQQYSVLGKPGVKLTIRRVSSTAASIPLSVLDAGGGGVDIGAAGAPYKCNLPDLRRYRANINHRLWRTKSNDPGTAIDSMSPREHATTVLGMSGTIMEHRHGQMRKFAFY